MDIKGRVHSIETMGTVDGPGIRYVVFMQGCPLRCKYCHNRDTWDMSHGRVMSVDELMQDIRKYRNFMKYSGGGVTLTGGEPTLQWRFVAELFRRCRQEGIHAALDTSGFVDLDKADAFLPYTDLVLLDIKEIDALRHMELTGVSNDKTLVFALHLARLNIPTWIRYVLVPGYTDDPNDIHELGQFISTLHNVERVEVLPYHTMGAYKWDQLGLDYPLRDVPEPTGEQIEIARGILRGYGLTVV